MITLFIAGFFGSVTKPPGVTTYGDYNVGLVSLLNNVLKLLIVGAGIFTLINIIVAGYTFLGAGGDSKKITEAWAKIWQSLLGLVFVAGSFLLAAIFGWLVFGDAGAIINPTIYTP